MNTKQPRVTFLLLNYKRPENLPALVESIRMQEEPANIFLWNNDESNVIAPVNAIGVDWVINSSINRSCLPRWYMANFAETEFVSTLDDDIAFADPMVLGDLLQFAEGIELDQAVGKAGVQLEESETYSDGIHVEGVDDDEHVDIVKGRFFFVRTAAVRPHTFACLAAPEGFGLEPYQMRSDDIWLSGALAAGRPCHHIVPAFLNNRFRELPKYGVGLEYDASHIDDREFVRRRVWAHYGATK